MGTGEGRILSAKEWNPLLLFIPREFSLGADQPSPSLGVSPEGTFISVSTK